MDNDLTLKAAALSTRSDRRNRWSRVADPSNSVIHPIVVGDERSVREGRAFASHSATQTLGPVVVYAARPVIEPNNRSRFDNAPRPEEAGASHRLHQLNRITITSGSPKRSDVDMNGAGWHWRVHIHDDSIWRHLGCIEQT